MTRASSNLTEPILSVGLPPPPSPHALTSASATAPRASMRERRMGQPPCLLRWAVRYDPYTRTIKALRGRLRNRVAAVELRARPEQVARQREGCFGDEHEGGDQDGSANGLTDVALRQ